MKRVVSIVILALLSIIIVYAENLFDKLRPMAIEGLQLSTSRSETDRQRSLVMLVEVVVRGQDWIDVNNSSDVQLMANVVATVISLKSELQAESYQELLRLLIHSPVASVTADDIRYGRNPGIFPESETALASDCGDIERCLEEAISTMKHADFQLSEQILLSLYDRTWTKQENAFLRHSVANKLILLYLRLGVFENAYRLLRQNKIEMEKLDIVNGDYLECLFYFGTYYSLTDEFALGKCYIETANEILRRVKIVASGVIKDFKAIMGESGEDIFLNDIYSFIEDNDKVFWFLTERERMERWGTVSYTWKSLKNNILLNADNAPEISDLFNASQYEKHILLRSYSKISSIIYESENESAIALLHNLNDLRMRMTSSHGHEWKNLQAEYQRVQKALMHNPVLDSLKGSLYKIITPQEVASQLSKRETYIDFVIANDGKFERYFAILINKNSPTGSLIPLCTKNDFHNFLESTASPSTREMVRRRYENEHETLYNLIWKPIYETGLLLHDILYSPTDELNLIMPDAILHNGKYLAEEFNFHILSSWGVPADYNQRVAKSGGEMAAFYDIDYRGDRQELIENAREYGCERPLKKHSFDDDEHAVNSAFSKAGSLAALATSREYDWLVDMAEVSKIKMTSFTRVNASEYAFKDLSTRFKSIVHVSTHAFCLPSNVSGLDYPYMMSQGLNLENCNRLTGVPLPMFRTGLLFSGGEREWTGKICIDGIEDGIVNGEELSSLDLHHVNLISLIACSTGAGEIDEYEGIIGLRRALKMAGCKTVVSTAWNIDKEAALTYVRCFYENIFSGIHTKEAHFRAIHKVMQRFESPYYWGAFQLID